MKKKMNFLLWTAREIIYKYKWYQRIFLSVTVYLLVKKNPDEISLRERNNDNLTNHALGTPGVDWCS